ncbi:hypothetical protein JGH11_14745 [Dysgonomonas sp. Marseille-P4677]|uniref:hypothetical protein n=1 Tax=Dysgonomonas sp. Marseille-P4677 TaxID=2364790 RepID=UPI001911E067|nr:hypothetical protein [Dysgonomonas sp. Marseille-P4677]MBK5722133.1 hypothetical protein [Dysgonomonas sp. Marseille-P4677]
MKHIEINSNSWLSLIEEINNTYNPGDIILHEWLKDRFHLQKPRFKDYYNEDDFIRGVGLYNLDYLTLIDTLREQLLKDCKICLRSIRNEGYSIIPPKEQVKYGYDIFIKELKSLIKKIYAIMNNVRPVSATQRAIANDKIARFSLIKQMLSGLK